jgi:hypothetical protein
MSNINIQLAAEFQGKKAFDKAGKSVTGLEKAVGKLGKQLAGVFALSQVTRFAKASVNAFLEAEKANVRLAGVVKNLGMAFETAGIQRNLDKISASSGIAGELLADAFQPLLTTTKSVTEAQNLLNLALDVAAGTGKNVAEVSQDLALAYTGVTRGLRKYNLGLTQAELKAASFEEVQSLLAKQFTGSNAKYLQTYAGQLGILTEAAGLAQETIGKGLVDALVLAGGKDADVQDVADAMQSLSTYTSDVIRGVGVLAGKLNNLSQKSGGLGLKDFVILIPILGGYISALEKAGRESRPMGRANRNVTGRTNVTLFDADAAKQKKLEADRLKVVKAQEALLKKQTAELKKQAITKKQSALFDLDQIQLVAALQGNLSKEEELRVKLQLALLTGNTDQAKKLADQLADSIDKTGKLKDFINTIPDAPNPFAGWDEWLKNFTKNLATVTGSTIPTTGGGVSPAPVTSIPSTNVPQSSGMNYFYTPSSSTTTADQARRLYGGMGSSQPTIVVQIDGKEIASAVQNQSLSGNDPLVNRLLGGFR